MRVLNTTPPGRAALLAKSLREAIHIESAIISPRTSGLIEVSKQAAEYLEGQADLPVGEDRGAARLIRAYERASDQRDLLETALRSMLTFYGMDEQRGEVSGTIHDRARAALKAAASGRTPISPDEAIGSGGLK
jgi:hypothetical protein